MTVHPNVAQRVVSAYAPFHVAELASWVIVLLYAFEDGGVARTSLAVAVQLIPAGAFAPAVGLLTSRFGAGRVLVIGYGVQSVALTGTAAAVLVGDPVAVYAVAALAASAMTVTRPAHLATLPGLCHSARDLVAANVRTSRLESVATFVGPLVSVAVVGPIGLGGGLLVSAAGSAAACGLSLPAWTERSSVGAVEAADLDPLRAGVRILASPPAMVLFGTIAIQTLLIGALEVMAAPLAELVLDVGSDASGLVMAALGLGGVLGSLALGWVAIGSRLAPSFIASLAVMGAGFVAAGRFTSVVLALAGFAVAGIGSAVTDGAGRTLIQRTVREDVIGRAFGVVESLRMFALAAGAALAPPVVSTFGVANAVAVAGAFGVATAVALSPAVARVSRAATVPVVEVALLRKLPIFQVLPPGPLEAVARHAQEERFATGDTIVGEGEIGDRYYAIVSGSCAAIRDSQRLDTMVRGDGFGERALLTNERRNATVVCIEDTVVLSIDGDAFLTALTDHAPCASRANLIAARRSAAVDRSATS
jgi:MFS family permease